MISPRLKPACLRCSEPVEEGAAFCPWCGAVTAAGRSLGIECDNHPSQPAVAQCLFCGKSVCGDCSVLEGGMTVCGNAGHAKILRDHLPVCSAATVFEADMFRKNLEIGGIAAQTAAGTGYVRALPLPVQCNVRVLVPREDVDRARELLRNLGLLDA